MDKKSTATRVLIGSAGVFSTDGITALPQDAAKPKPTGMKDEENEDSGGEPWAKYGDEDNFPTLLLDKLKMLSIGKRAICVNSDSHYGAGIDFFLKEVTDSKIIKRPVVIPEWDEFKENTNFDLVLSDAIELLETYYWVPIRCLTNVGKTKIVELEALDPYFCRLGKRDKKGMIRKLYYSYKFPETPNKADRVEYDLFDPSAPDKFTEFIILLKYSTSGKIYYPEPDYYAVFRNGWVDVACSVPEFIKTMYDQSATIKYHVKIPTHYFVNKYKDWAEKSEEEQIAVFKEEQKNMNDFLLGKKNAHKLFVSVFGMDDNGNEISGWEIVPLADYMKKDAELPNNAAANSEILFAFGVDPSSIGLGIPGGKNLSGSGSDKREGIKIKQAFLFRERLVSLQLVRFIVKFCNIPTNGALPRYVDIDTSQTLDENPTGKQTVVNG